MLVAVLGEVAAAAGVHIRGFADMGVDEIASLTGLTREGAERALDREYDEPYVVYGDEDALAALRTAAELRGFGVSHGGRFHHLTGGSDKGLAVRALLACYERAGRRCGSIGLGDAATDLSFLRAVDRAIVVPGRDGTFDPILAAALPEAERAPAPGPAGWNAAVNTLLEGGRLPLIGRR
jgi:mannosyl-3-phosphoglycerate phosphatase